MRCLVFLSAMFFLHPRSLISQIHVAESAMLEYVESSKIDHDNFMITVKTNFSTEPDVAFAHSGFEQYVKLVSKTEDIVWERASRKIELAVQYEAIPDFAKSDSWSSLRHRGNLYGLSFGSFRSTELLFAFELLGSHSKGKCFFPSLFSWPFAPAAMRTNSYPEDFASKIFLEATECISAVSKDGLLKSTWVYPQGTGLMWDVAMKNGKPVIVTLFDFDGKIDQSNPNRGKASILSEIRTDWKEDIFGTYPSKIIATHKLPNSGVETSAFMILEANISVDSQNAPFNEELERIKKRLNALEAN